VIPRFGGDKLLTFPASSTSLIEKSAAEELLTKMKSVDAL